VLLNPKYMSRYFAELCYKGTHYSGWQKQENATTIQEQVEEALSTLLRSKIEVLGCGRTDSGVHALQFYLHFDFIGDLPDRIAGRLNMMLPPDISVKKVFQVQNEAHARFDASLRAYRYVIVRNKSPFQKDLSFRYYRFDHLDKKLLQESVRLLLSYEEFYPFCKSKTDVKTMKCQLFRCEWEIGSEEIIFHISANRFLRGMVRLIVGMSLRVANGDIDLADIKQALDKQKRPEKAWSVPADGLFLCKVEYPDSIFQ
jgi:tRNA pseudouridine38-40 synthase